MIVSIDIGTSYSSICILGPDKKAVPVDISTGASMYGSKYSLPSAVFVDENGKVLVGQAAMNSRKRLPQNFRMEFKRDLGQDIPVMLGTRKFLPRDFYTEMFRHMTECAKKTSGEQIEKAYITYPASYGKKKREQIEDAAKKAGLFEIELVDEPTAAAMCYCDDGYVKEGDKFLIYDFGGGTFDVCAVKYEGGKFSIVGEPDGIENCGGIDIDRLIYQDMLSKLDKDTLEMVNQKPINRMRLDSQLAELAIKAKHHLSSAESFNEDIQIGFDLIPYRLSRIYLDSMMSTLISQTIETCRNVLKEAGLKTHDLSAILMVGGTSRIPLVQSLVKQFAGNVPVQSYVDLELAVASGALGVLKYKNISEYKKKENSDNTFVSKQKDNFVEMSNKKENIEPDVFKYILCQEELKNIPKISTDTIDIEAIIKKNKTVSCLSYSYERFEEEISTWRDIKDIVRVGHDIVGLKTDGSVLVCKEYKGRVGVDNYIDKSKKVSAIFYSQDKKSIAFLYENKTVTALRHENEGFKLYNLKNWENIVYIALGSYHIVGLRSDGTVVAAGSNNDGQCNTENWNNIVSISCGYYHTVGLKKDGTIVAVGNNKFGQCYVSDWKDINKVMSNGYLTIGLNKDGTVATAGDHSDVVYEAIKKWKNISYISCGGLHMVGLTKNGTVVAAGDNKYGQCDVSDWKDVVSIYTTLSDTVAIKKDGTIIKNHYDLIDNKPKFSMFGLRYGNYLKRVKDYVFSNDDRYKIVKRGTITLDEKAF